jgi:hypothetical protein
MRAASAARDLTIESTTGGPESPSAPGARLVSPARKGNAVGVPRTLPPRNTGPTPPTPLSSEMNKRKNSDESVIFPKIFPGNRPQFHETSFHVSSSDRQEDQPPTPPRAGLHAARARTRHRVISVRVHRMCLWPQSHRPPIGFDGAPAATNNLRLRQRMAMRGQE